MAAAVRGGEPVPVTLTPEQERDYLLNKNRLPESGLNKICSLVSFAELCRLRGVCRFWNEYVTKMPSYWGQQHVVTDKNWVRERLPIYNPHTTSQWKNLTLNQYTFKFNAFSRSHWPQMKLSITTIVFKDIKIQCDRLAMTINEMTHLTSVSLINVNFPSPAYIAPQDVAQRGVTPQLFCTHRGLEDIRRLVRQQGRVRTIVSHGHPVIPNCVMHVLGYRSTGTLREFEFSKSIRMDPDPIQPRANQVEGSIVTVLMAPNVHLAASLQKLTVKDLSSGMTILSDFAQRVPNLGLQEVALAQTNGNDLVQTGRILDFINWQQPKHTLRSVDLTIQNNWNVDILFTSLLGMVGLEKLRLHFGPRELENRNVDLIPLQHIHTLRELEVSSAAIVADQIVNPTYLGLLRPTLRKLILDDHGLVEADFMRFLDSRAGINLDELHILNGAGVTNTVMAKIITTLPQLEKLSVNGAGLLTDSGILGWPQDAVSALLKANCLASMIHGEEVTQALVGPSIKQLRRLRSLNLRRCSKISDISAIRGFSFPNLRELNISNLNITNIGLLWLAHNNPGLEKLTCEQNNKISRFGLNQLLISYPTIMKIKTNSALLEKSIGNIRFANAPRFRTAVTKTN